MFKEVTTEAELRETVEENQNKLVVLDFFAPWAEPCVGIEPYFERFSRKHNGVVSLKLNVDNTVFMDVMEKYKVDNLPCFLFLRHGKEIDRLEKGARIGLEQKINEHSGY